MPAVTIERERLSVIRDHGENHEHCEVCGLVVKGFDIEQSARIANVPSDEIIRRVQTGELHLTDPSSTSVLVCFRSLNQNVFGG